MLAHMSMSQRGFFGAFLGDHRVAAVRPSSGFLIRRLLKKLDLEHIETIVEYGPGDGVATFPILKALGPKARYVAIERNPTFAAHLAGADPRLEAVEGDVREALPILAARGVTAADAIIASTPFTYFRPAEREAIVAGVKKLLKPGGTFVVFHQYSPLMLPCLRRHFQEVRTELELRNVPPCFLFACR